MIYTKARNYEQTCERVCFFYGVKMKRYNNLYDEM